MLHQQVLWFLKGQLLQPPVVQTQLQWAQLHPVQRLPVLAHHLLPRKIQCYFVTPYAVHVA